MLNAVLHQGLMRKEQEQKMWIPYALEFVEWMAIDAMFAVNVLL